MSAVVSAQGNAPGVRPDPTMPSSEVPAALSQVSFEQRLNEQLPLDLPFKDETGRVVRLGEYFGRKPVVLTFVYYECPMLCTQVLNGLESALRVLSETIGKEFDIVTVSFDPKETPVLAAGKKKAYLERYQRPEAAAGLALPDRRPGIDRHADQGRGFQLLVGRSVAPVRACQRHRGRDAGRQGVAVFFGIDYSPRDVKFALIESSNERIGTLAERLLLYCYHYDPAQGNYGFVAMRAVRIGGGLTLLALAGFVFVSIRSDFAKASSRQAGDVSK